MQEQRHFFRVKCTGAFLNIFLSCARRESDFHDKSLGRMQKGEDCRTSFLDSICNDLSCIQFAAHNTMTS